MHAFNWVRHQSFLSAASGDLPVPCCNASAWVYCAPSCVHSFIPDISIILYIFLQFLYFSDALPTTALILCQSYTPKCYKKLWVKDLPKISWLVHTFSTLDLYKNLGAFPFDSCWSYIFLSWDIGLDPTSIHVHDSFWGAFKMCFTWVQIYTYINMHTLHTHTHARALTDAFILIFYAWFTLFLTWF